MDERSVPPQAAQNLRRGRTRNSEQILSDIFTRTSHRSPAEGSEDSGHNSLSIQFGYGSTAQSDSHATGLASSESNL